MNLEIPLCSLILFCTIKLQKRAKNVLLEILGRLFIKHSSEQNNSVESASKIQNLLWIKNFKSYWIEQTCWKQLHTMLSEVTTLNFCQLLQLSTSAGQYSTKFA